MIIGAIVIALALAGIAAGYLATQHPEKATAVVTWLKNDFGEWFIGSWAMIIGWGIIAFIFGNLLVMDGHFSRGLGEGSGIDPGLFQHIGWMFGLFAAVFLVLSVKFEAAGLKASALTIKCLGGACTVIVMMHAVGFGLKALEGKRAMATAVEKVAEVHETTNVDILAQLRAQIVQIDTDLASKVAPINSEIAKLDDDGRADNDKRSDDLRVRRIELENNASAAKDKINEAITAQITSGGTQKAANVNGIETTEKWSPLYVGLAQAFTRTKEPTDWAIYLAGVIFNICWMLMAHGLVIGLPPALYKLHLKDAKRKRMAEMGEKGGRASAKAKMRKLITYAAQAQKGTKADMSAEKPDEDDEDDEPPVPKQAAE